MADSTNCEGCKFWSEGYEPGYGECHRRAPFLVQGQFEPTVKDGTIPQRDALWPVTSCDEWCAEGEPALVGGESDAEDTPGRASTSAIPDATRTTTPHSGAIPDGQADDPETVAKDCQSVGPTPEGAIASEHKANGERKLQPEPTR